MLWSSSSPSWLPSITIVIYCRWSLFMPKGLCDTKQRPERNHTTYLVRERQRRQQRFGAVDSAPTHRIVTTDDPTTNARLLSKNYNKTHPFRVDCVHALPRSQCRCTDPSVQADQEGGVGKHHFGNCEKQLDTRPRAVQKMRVIFPCPHAKDQPDAV